VKLPREIIGPLGKAYWTTIQGCQEHPAKYPDYYIVKGIPMMHFEDMVGKTVEIVKVGLHLTISPGRRYVPKPIGYIIVTFGPNDYGFAWLDERRLPVGYPMEQAMKISRQKISKIEEEE